MKFFQIKLVVEIAKETSLSWKAFWPARASDQIPEEVLVTKFSIAHLSRARVGQEALDDGCLIVVIS